MTPANIYSALRRAGVDITDEDLEIMLKEEGILLTQKIDFSEFKKIVLPVENFIRKTSLQSKRSIGALSLEWGFSFM